jgi:hypothetical protein
MEKYVINSPRLGTVGADYDAEAAAATGVNVDALILGGFITKVSAPKPPKNAKKDVETDEEN